MRPTDSNDPLYVGGRKAASTLELDVQLHPLLLELYRRKDSELERVGRTGPY